MKQIALALACGLALALIAALVLRVIMQRQFNSLAQQDQQGIEARRLEEQQQQQVLKQQRLAQARRLFAERQRQERQPITLICQGTMSFVNPIVGKAVKTQQQPSAQSGLTIDKVGGKVIWGAYTLPITENKGNIIVFEGDT